MIFIIILFCLIVGEVLSHIKYVRAVNLVFGITFLYLVCAKTTWTPDWAFYKIYYDLGGADKEWLFRKLIGICKSLDFAFSEFHTIYILIYSILLVLFAYKFNYNVLIPLIFFISIDFLFYSTQIRYFLAFFIGCWSTYFYFVHQRYFLSAALFVLAVLAHDGIIFMLPVIFSSYLLKKNVFLIIFVSLLISIGISQLVPYADILFGSRFTAYVKDKNLLSSIGGGIFYFMPFILNFYLITKYYRRNEQYIPSNYINKVSFLFKMGTFYYLYLGIALMFQVIGHRYIVTSSIFQLLLFFLVQSFVPKRIRIANYFIFGIYMAMFFILLYVIPSYVIEKADNTEVVIKMLRSNPFISEIL